MQRLWQAICLALGIQTSNLRFCRLPTEAQTERKRRNSLRSPIEGRNCAYEPCGRSFKPSSRNRNFKFCSPKCRYTQIRLNHRPSLERRLCALPGCGVYFAPKGLSDRWRYCSKAHMRIGVKDGQLRKGMRRPRSNGEHVHALMLNAASFSSRSGSRGIITAVRSAELGQHTKEPSFQQHSG